MRYEHVKNVLYNSVSNYYFKVKNVPLFVWRYIFFANM